MSRGSRDKVCTLALANMCYYMHGQVTLTYACNVHVHGMLSFLLHHQQHLMMIEPIR